VVFKIGLSLVTWALVLLSPVIAFLMIITAEVLIDLLMEAGVIGVCAIAAGLIGWALFRRMSRRRLTPLSADDEGLGQPAIAG
jgi:nitrate reductase gamma subunit